MSRSRRLRGPQRGLQSAASALACGALVAACASGARGGEMEPRYVAVHNALAAMGMAQVGPIQRGSLALGREARFDVELAAGCTTIIALGGDGVRDLDAALIDPGGARVAHDTTRDPEAVVRACVDHAGTFALVVKMADGGGDFLAATWSGGSEPTAPAAPGQAVAVNGAPPTGTCEAPIPITAGQYAGSTAHGDSANEASCASSSSKELVYRLDLASRQRVTIDVDPTFDSVLHVRKEDCNDVEAEVACNDDVGHERRSRVDEVLEPGTYFVFVDGLANEQGSFRMKAVLEDVPTIAEVCRGARALPPGLSANGATTNGFDSAQSTCGDGAKGPDVAYKLDLVTRARVRVTEHSSDFKPAVHVRRSCTDESTEVACSDDGMTDDDAVYTGLLEAGSYAVFADSSERDGNGHYMLLAETSPTQGTGSAGDGCSDALPLPQAGRVEGDTFPSRDDVAGTCSGAGAPDEVYRFDVTHRVRLTAHFVKQEGEHVFVLTRACGDVKGEMACGPTLDKTLAPGTYWLAIDGATPNDFGHFSFEARARDLVAQEGACKGAPSLRAGTDVSGTTDNAGDRFTTSCGGREENQSSPDRLYRLTLAARTHLSLVLTTPTWDGVLVVRRSCADVLPSPGAGATGAASAELRCNNDADGDTHRSKIDAVLDAGTYYVLVDGHSANNAGSFSLAYRVLPLK